LLCVLEADAPDTLNLTFLKIIIVLLLIKGCFDVEWLVLMHLF